MFCTYLRQVLDTSRVKRRGDVPAFVNILFLCTGSFCFQPLVSGVCMELWGIRHPRCCDVIHPTSGDMRCGEVIYLNEGGTQQVNKRIYLDDCDYNGLHSFEWMKQSSNESNYNGLHSFEWMQQSSHESNYNGLHSFEWMKQSSNESNYNGLHSFEWIKQTSKWKQLQRLALTQMNKTFT